MYSESPSVLGTAMMFKLVYINNTKEFLVMNKQRKMACIILFSLIVSIFSFINVSADVSTLRIGDEIGNVLNTDIKTFINGHRIPSYNINNRSAVLIKDLVNYGFNSVYNDQTRTSSVTFNPSKRVTPLTDFDETTGLVGTVAFRYVYTDIVAFVNGNRVESFNIKGNLAIFFADLRDYGTFSWSESTRESRFTSSKPVTGLTLSRTAVTMRVNDSAVRLTATIAPADATNKSVTWSSSNPNVARVSDGNITAIAPGTAVITATSSNGITATCTVTVNPATVAVTGVTLNRETAALTVGEVFTLTATIAPVDATDKTLTWTSSHPRIASVSDGVVTAIAAGTATITVTSSSRNIVARCTVTVQPAIPDVTNITLDRTTLTIALNGWAQLTPTITPSTAANVALTWTSSNNNVATVQNGYILAVSAGTTTIKVTAPNGRFAECTVTVSAASAITNITLPSTATVGLNQGVELIPTILPATATTNPNLTWTSSNQNIAVVYNGYVVGIALGTATITVEAPNGVKATCTVTVTAASAITSITLDKTTATLEMGQGTQLTPTILPATAATNPNLTWSSSNNSVAIVQNGYVVGLTAGTATITVTAPNGIKATCTVTVTATGTSGVTISPSSSTVTVGGFTILTATVTSTTATTTGLVWSSSNTAIATVSGLDFNNLTGFVQGHTQGTVIITLSTATGVVLATATVTVTP